MESSSQLAATYQHMSDGELLQISREGGLLPEAKQALYDEIRSRNLKSTDLPHTTEPHKTALEKESGERWLPLSWYRDGFGLYGRSYLNQQDRASNIQVRTKFLVLAGLPLVPRASYRFKYPGPPKKWGWWNDADGHVLGRIPIVWSQVFRVWLTTLLWIVGTIAAVVLYEKLRGR